jgi:redox-sensitive bicupin YhaK (pirin superfamily)
MENSSTILPGEVQIMSAGTGVFHSEFNHEKAQETHLLQIWILPKQREIAPRYEQKSFAAEFAKNDLTLVVSGSKRDGSLEINQDVEIFVGKFMAQKSVDFAIKKDRKIWLQIISGEMLVNDLQLENGDALAIENEEIIKLTALKNCEFLLFDL